MSGRIMSLVLSLFAAITIARSEPPNTDGNRSAAKVVLRSPTGHAFTLISGDESDGENVLLPMIPAIAHRPDHFAMSAEFARTAAAGDPDEFGGIIRAGAKTSIASARIDSYANLPALLTFLDRAEMRNPSIHDSDSNRVPLEKKNVSVSAYLYAVKKQRNDNDYHIILGSSPTSSAATKFFNVEISGIPADDNGFRARLTRVRTKFENWLAQSRSAGAAAHVAAGAQKVRVKGSIFFDTHHPAGEIGAGEFHPATAWEIHPVSEIIFNP